MKAKETFRYKMQKFIFTFIGDVKWHGWSRPLWFTINAKTFQLKGKHCRTVEQLIQPGDILLRRFEGYIDKIFIPGWLNHSGIYVGEIGGRDHGVVHAISDGVIVDDLIDFMRTDHAVILRAPRELREEALRRAVAVVGSDYDFAFDFNETLRFSCTELVSYCYPGIIQGKRRFGHFMIIADDIVNTPILNTIWDSRLAI